MGPFELGHVLAARAKHTSTLWPDEALKKKGIDRLEGKEVSSGEGRGTAMDQLNDFIQRGGGGGWRDLGTDNIDE
jgi:hypothetical protein